jgi:hypothetical protein
MKIEHNIRGIQDFCIAKLEEFDSDNDLKPEFKLKAFGVMLQQLRGFSQLDLQHRNLLIKAPLVAKDRTLEMPLGKPQLKAIDGEVVPEQAEAQRAAK